MVRKRTSRCRLWILAVTVILETCLLVGSGLPAGLQSRSVKANRKGQPALVLAIVVDQFRYDFLLRFGDSFGSRGFRRLIDQGAVFANCNYDYVPTYTAPGHAAIFTGSVPMYNGIVGNTWFDRGSSRVRVMVSDDSVKTLRSPSAATPASQPPGVSPRNLIGTTIGDQLRLSNSLRSKVVGASFKDRSAILPGGKRPNGAYWFEAPSGTFVSTDYYFKDLPAWVNRFNETVRPDRHFGAKWEALLPSKVGDDQPDLRNSLLGKGFPYTIDGGEQKPGPRFYSAFELSPFASEYLADFARAAIEAESLGRDEFPDLLSISFSTPDLIGHSYGPDSREVAETYVRLDRVVADLLDYVERTVGLTNTIVFVTADHGVSPIPERLQSLGFDAGRLSSREVVDVVNSALVARFGEGKWVLAFVNDQLYLDRSLISERKLNSADVQRAAGEAALGIPGIIDFFTRDQITEGRMTTAEVSRRVVNGFNRIRSGDVWLITKPFTFVAEGSLATTHGSPYSYDTHVPLILFGAEVKPGRYDFACSPSDIAPTLASLLRVEPPANHVGRVLPVVDGRR